MKNRKTLPEFLLLLGKKSISQSAGLEPALPEGIWFLVRRLNHSATTASYKCNLKIRNNYNFFYFVRCKQLAVCTNFATSFPLESVSATFEKKFSECKWREECSLQKMYCLSWHKQALKELHLWNDSLIYRCFWRKRASTKWIFMLRL